MFTTRANTTSFASLRFSLFLPNLTNLLLRFLHSNYVLVKSYDIILSCISNISLAISDRCCSTTPFIPYSFFALQYSLSLIILSFGKPVSSQMVEFSLTHLVVANSEAGYTARLITSVCNNCISCSLNLFFARALSVFRFAMCYSTTVHYPHLWHLYAVCYLYRPCGYLFDRS